MLSKSEKQWIEANATNETDWPNVNTGPDPRSVREAQKVGGTWPRIDMAELRRMVEAGHQNKVIAQSMGLHPSTVGNHAARIRREIANRKQEKST